MNNIKNVFETNELELIEQALLGERRTYIDMNTRLLEHPKEYTTKEYSRTAKKIDSLSDLIQKVRKIIVEREEVMVQ